LWVGKRKVYTKHGEFYGAPRGGGSTGSLTEHGGFTEHPGEVEARRVLQSTQGSWKHGGFTEQGERSGEHGNLNGGRLEDALLFYLSMLL
jgi:hypothetical protein